MIVTINTDAAFNHQYKVGAYAFWITYSDQVIADSGVLKKTANPTDAELQCMANALHTVLNTEIATVTKIIINSDALCAFRMVKHNSKKNSAQKIVFTLLQDLQKKYRPNKPFGRPIHKFNHVKAHSGTDTHEKSLNNWCDKTAKTTMRTHVKKLKSIFKC